MDARYLELFYRAAMTVGSCFCHQISERSPVVFGLQMPLCWRCSGIVLGSVIFALWILLHRDLHRTTICVVFIVFMPADVVSGSSGSTSGQ
ncbi:MAG: DUF2085 domain-containing protein [Acidobacteria bacterium]|nr:DUF2085 domain-containing protein [Acidobacteriota bacterium]